MFFGTFNLTTSGLSPGHRAVHFFTTFPNWGQTLKSEFQIKSYDRLKFYFEKTKKIQIQIEKKNKKNSNSAGWTVRSGPGTVRSSTVHGFWTVRVGTVRVNFLAENPRLDRPVDRRDRTVPPSPVRSGPGRFRGWSGPVLGPPGFFNTLIDAFEPSS